MERRERNIFYGDSRVYASSQLVDALKNVKGKVMPWVIERIKNGDKVLIETYVEILKVFDNNGGNFFSKE